MIIEYVSVSTGRVLDTISGDRVADLVYATGRARGVVETVTRPLPERDQMAALTSWSNGYVQLRAVEA